MRVTLVMTGAPFGLESFGAYTFEVVGPSVRVLDDATGEFTARHQLSASSRRRIVQMARDQVADANRVVSQLLSVEVDGSVDPDARRFLRQERFAVESAIRSGDGDEMAAAAAEARRVAGMWGVALTGQ